MMVDGLERLGIRWRVNPRPDRTIDRLLLDELEVGERAAKVWAWTEHYCPPEQYARIRREDAARAARRATAAAEPTPLPLGQLDLFAEAS